MGYKTIYICDWCDSEIRDNSESVDIEINRNDIGCYCICPSCYNRLKFLMNWKENKNRKVALNLNNMVEMTLGKDGTEAWNNRFKNIGYIGDTNIGDTVSSGCHEMIRGLSPAFVKCVGGYQSIAIPFEMRFKVCDLKPREGNEQWDEY